MRVGVFRRASRSWEVAQWIPLSRIVLLCEICWFEKRPLGFIITRIANSTNAIPKTRMVMSNFSIKYVP